ncbi:MAG: response regulator transcription factor [Asticcacaulis sp.]|uniref:winged helix-turn-helix domain-containing protein n=1 Tax=Asticcacaulis sp. TaxID=1872648 RepID=UPI0039E4179F
MYIERTDRNFGVTLRARGHVLSTAGTFGQPGRAGSDDTDIGQTSEAQNPKAQKHHILILQIGVSDKPQQHFKFDPEVFDVTLRPWSGGSDLVRSVVPVSLVIVEFVDGAYVDTGIYKALAYSLPGVPVIMLARCEGAIDRIVALEVGFADFVSKPAHPRELEARARAILRYEPVRGKLQEATGVTYGGIYLSYHDRSATTARGHARLTNVEFCLLNKLIDAGGRMVTREALMECLAEDVKDTHREYRGIDVTISRLRRKIDIPGQESLIRTARGKGYCI